jgi:ABC-type glycerol-3-phosphate transport system permease component
MIEQSNPVRRPLLYLAMVALVIAYLFPIYWTLLSSFKPTSELVRQDTYWPAQFVLSHYEQVLAGTPFLMYLRNSLVVALGTVVITVVLASTAAYSLSRMQFRGRRLFGQLVPGHSLGYSSLWDAPAVATV